MQLKCTQTIQLWTLDLVTTIILIYVYLLFCFSSTILGVEMELLTFEIVIYASLD